MICPCKCSRHVVPSHSCLVCSSSVPLPLRWLTRFRRPRRPPRPAIFPCWDPARAVSPPVPLTNAPPPGATPNPRLLRVCSTTVVPTEAAAPRRGWKEPAPRSATFRAVTIWRFPIRSPTVPKTVLTIGARWDGCVAMRCRISAPTGRRPLGAVPTPTSGSFASRKRPVLHAAMLPRVPNY